MTKTFVLVIGHRGRAIKTSSGAIIYLRCDYNYNAVKAFSMIALGKKITVENLRFFALFSLSEVSRRIWQSS